MHLLIFLFPVRWSWGVWAHHNEQSWKIIAFVLSEWWVFVCSSRSEAAVVRLRSVHFSVVLFNEGHFTWVTKMGRRCIKLLKSQWWGDVCNVLTTQKKDMIYWTLNNAANIIYCDLFKYCALFASYTFTIRDYIDMQTDCSYQFQNGSKNGIWLNLSY